MSERLYSLLLTAAEIKELDTMTYAAASYERCKATAYGRDMDETIANLRGKVILLTRKVQEDNNERHTNTCTARAHT